MAPQTIDMNSPIQNANTSHNTIDPGPRMFQKKYNCGA